jgi:tripartite-type tricarboxylate transporter receptor subunit TctC
VPAGTSADLVAQLNRDANSVLRQPDVRERLTGLGMEVRAGTPDSLDKLVRGEIAKWKDVAKAAHIKAE